MRVGFWNLYEMINDRLFVEPNAPIGDDLLLPFMRLREAGRQRGITCEVLARENFASLDAIVFIDFPDAHNRLVTDALSSGKPLYLLVFEPPHVRPENATNEWRFTRVFTWDDRSVGLRYVKLNYAQEFPKELPPADGRKQLCMIAANKHSRHPASLYHRREEVATYFECWKNSTAHQAFDLYGPGWNGFPNWRGTIAPGGKRAALVGYRYAVVFENGCFPGYITEKLFDCFIAGTVPLYLGAPNVGEYVPSECYVDLSRFGETWTRVGRMWTWLEEHGEAEYAKRREAIAAFLTSPAAEPFTTARFASTILDTLDGDLTIV